MKRFLASAVVALAASAAAPATAGQLDAASGIWHPVGCAEPVAPPREADSATSLNDSIIRYNAYVDRVTAFNECVRNEAARDMNRIREQAERAQITAVREAEAGRLGPAGPR